MSLGFYRNFYRIGRSRPTLISTPYKIKHDMRVKAYLRVLNGYHRHPRFGVQLPLAHHTAAL